MEGRRFVRPLERVYTETRLSDRTLAEVYQNLLPSGPVEFVNPSQGRHQPAGRSRKRRRSLVATGGRS